MDLRNPDFSPSPRHVWEDLVDDFLEIACILTEPERLHLIDVLRRQRVRADTIQKHHGFSVAGRLVIVSNSDHAAECWIYYPKKRKIVKFKSNSNGGE
jgi:hypothetical protein